MAGYSCQEEYDYDMSYQAEADAEAEYHENCAIEEAVRFLISMNFTPEMYAEAFKNKKMEESQ